MKYTPEILRKAAQSNTNMTDFLRDIQASLTSMSSRARIKAVCKSHNIDLSHFKQRRPVGNRPNKKSWETILVYNRRDGLRENSKRLRTALIESGSLEICTVCSLGSMWNNIKLRLEIDHIDDNPLNNVKKNLRFICPNCHSQKGSAATTVE